MLANILTFPQWQKTYTEAGESLFCHQQEGTGEVDECVQVG